MHLPILYLNLPCLYIICVKRGARAIKCKMWRRGRQIKFQGRRSNQSVYYVNYNENETNVSDKSVNCSKKSKLLLTLFALKQQTWKLVIVRLSPPSRCLLFSSTRNKISFSNFYFGKIFKRHREKSSKKFENILSISRKLRMCYQKILK